MTTWRVLFRGLSVMVAISLIAATVETRHALSTQQHYGKPLPYRFFTNGDGRVLSLIQNINGTICTASAFCFVTFSANSRLAIVVTILLKRFSVPAISVCELPV
ncbi:hypothetical protein [Desulforhopalus vacuolatus]|uniref:hypothetical protein n=1 Tax=Desulforhopalus vacuolatus TaxID=40414 RepID=UPI0019640770|nr:hypothetical protein [Desulforhopalus vacuolatus]